MTAMFDMETRAISISRLEILALKKLAVVSGALGDALTGQTQIEQRALTRALVGIINRLE